MSGLWGIAHAVIEMTGGNDSPSADHTLPPWSVGELLSTQLEDWRELIAWQALPGTINGFSNSRRIDLPFEGTYTYQACAGLALILVLVHELRYSAGFSDLWPNLDSSSWPKDTFLALFGQNGQPTVLVKTALHMAAKQFNLRHSFFAGKLSETQKYRNTILLQIGVPLEALFKLPDYVDQPPQTVRWLIGDQKALQDSRFTLDGQQQSEDLLALRSPSFIAAWNLLRRWRNANIGEARLREEFLRCNWFSGFRIEEVLDAARRWKPRPAAAASTLFAGTSTVPFMGEIYLRVERTTTGRCLAFSSALVNLDELGLEENEASLRLRLNDKPVPKLTMWEPQLSLPRNSNEVRCDLYSESELKLSCNLRLWESDRTVSVFRHPGSEGRPARQVLPRQWASMSPTRSYVLLLRDDVTLEGAEGAEELELAAPGWRAVELPPGSWNPGKLEATLDGALVFWTDSAVSIELPDLACCFSSPQLPALARQFMPYTKLVNVFNHGDEDVRAFVSAGHSLTIGIRLTKATQLLRVARCENAKAESINHEIEIAQVNLTERVGLDGLPIDLAIAPYRGQRAVWHRLWLPIRTTGLLLRRREGWAPVIKPEQWTSHRISLRFADEKDGWELQLGHRKLCTINERFEAQLPALPYGLPLALASQTDRKLVAESTINTGELRKCSVEDHTLHIEERRNSEDDSNHRLAVLYSSGEIEVVAGLKRQAAVAGTIEHDCGTRKPLVAVLIYGLQPIGRWWWPSNFEDLRDWSKADVLRLYPFMRWAGTGVATTGVLKRLINALNADPYHHLISIARSCAPEYDNLLGFPAKSSATHLLEAWTWQEALRCLLSQVRINGAYQKWRSDLPSLALKLQELNPVERSTTLACLAQLDPFLIIVLHHHLPRVLDWIERAANLQHYGEFERIPEALLRGDTLSGVLRNGYRRLLANDPNYAFTLLDKRRKH